MYEWNQTLDAVTVFVLLPDKVKATSLDIKLTCIKLTAGLKGQPPILSGDWFKNIKTDESMWSVESHGDKRILHLTLKKFEGQEWWNSVLKGDINSTLATETGAFSTPPIDTVPRSLTEFAARTSSLPEISARASSSTESPSRASSFTESAERANSSPETDEGLSSMSTAVVNGSERTFS
jgi:hypothetical protein